MLRLILTSTMIWSMSLVASAQIDTIKFKSGVKVATNIDSVSKAARLIYYHTKQVNQVVSFDIVAYYFYKNEWYVVAVEPREISNRFRSTAAKPPPTLNHPIQKWLATPLEPEQNFWRVYTNILGIWDDNSVRNSFQELKQLSLEPEYNFGQWAFKFPVKYGIDNQQYDVRYTQYLYFHDRYWSSSLPYRVGSYEVPKDAPYMGLPEYEVNDGYRYHYSSDNYAKSLFQIGFNPKVYLQKHRRKKRSVYLSAGFSYGVGDFGAVTSYETLDYRDESWRGHYYREWRLEHRERVVTQNLFDYFRHEYMLGVELNFLKHWCLNAEVGWTSPLRNKGQLENIVYARYDNRPYEEVLRYHYNPSMSPAATANILIGYRFR